MPLASKQPNLSLAFLATFMMHKNNKKYIKIKHTLPKKPVSSAMIEKIKSLSANGKNKYFCLELKSPEPKNPPSEIPSSDCTN